MCHNQGHLWYLHTTGSSAAKSVLTITETNPSFSSFLGVMELILERLVSRWDRDLLELRLSKDWPVFVSWVWLEEG